MMVACLIPVSVTAQSAASLAAKGDELFDEGKYQDAIAAYNESVTLDPNQARAWAGMGYAMNAIQD
jgi:Flp pilus assembly protein TadD